MSAKTKSNRQYLISRFPISRELIKKKIILQAKYASWNGKVIFNRLLKLIKQKSHLNFVLSKYFYKSMRAIIF